MGVFSQINNCQQKNKNKKTKKTKKKQKGGGEAPLLGLAKSIYYTVQNVQKVVPQAYHPLFVWCAVHL